MKKMFITSLVSLSTSFAMAAPGYVAGPATLNQLALRSPTMISYLLNDALTSKDTTHEYAVTLNRKDPQNPGKMMQQQWPITLVFEDRQEPDAPVGAALLMVDEKIFELGQIDIGSVEVKGDLVTISGGAGYLYNSAIGKTCGRFSGADRTIVLKFSFNEKTYNVDAALQSQKDTAWCN